MDNKETIAKVSDETSVSTKKKKSGKDIALLILNIVIWVFVAFAVLVTVVIFVSFGNEDGIPSFGKTMWISVQSESMTGVFDKGDLIFAEKLTSEEQDSMKVGDIITFKVDLNDDGVLELNSHEIILVEGEGTEFLRYTTKGVNNDLKDEGYVMPRDIVAKYNGKKVSGLGGVLDFLQSKVGFGVFVVLPVIALFIYYLINFIMLVRPKKALSADEEAQIKQRAIEEYLRMQQDGKAAESVDETAPSEENAANNDSGENKE